MPRLTVHVRELLNIFFIALTALSSPIALNAATNPPCPTVFQTFGSEGAKWEDKLNHLVAIEPEITIAETTISDRVRKAGFSARESFELANQKHLEISQIHIDYNALSDDLLSEDIARIGNFDARLATLRSRLEQATEVKRASVTGASDTVTQAKPDFARLIEKPTEIREGTRYEVPQASGVAGSTSAKKLSVSFTREVLDYFGIDLERGSRFLRAIQKGYIGSGSGSGIVRITDHHEDLVEIKVIGGKEGNQRLIGCRRADGYIEVLKVYEKRNEGGGGSLKHFAELCD